MRKNYQPLLILNNMRFLLLVIVVVVASTVSASVPSNANCVQSNTLFRVWQTDQRQCCDRLRKAVETTDTNPISASRSHFIDVGLLCFTPNGTIHRTHVHDVHWFNHNSMIWGIRNITWCMIMIRLWSTCSSSLFNMVGLWFDWHV